MDTHYFHMSSMAFFICILFDVIAFNMLKVLHIFCSVSSVCSFPVASAASWGLQARQVTSSTYTTLQFSACVSSGTVFRVSSPFLGLSFTNGSKVFLSVRCISVSFK